MTRAQRYASVRTGFPYHRSNAYSTAPAAAAKSSNVCRRCSRCIARMSHEIVQGKSKLRQSVSTQPTLVRP